MYKSSSGTHTFLYTYNKTLVETPALECGIMLPRVRFHSISDDHLIEGRLLLESAPIAESTVRQFSASVDDHDGHIIPEVKRGMRN